METKHALIAADVDKTILSQNKNDEAFDFINGVGHELITAARNGFKIAFITGNSMEQLTSRLLKLLVEALCNGDQLKLVSNFHFICNAGGVYFHINGQHDELRKIINKTNQKESFSEVMRILTGALDKDNYFSICPEFIDPCYLKKTMIAQDEVDAIKKILTERAKSYCATIEKNLDRISKIYDLSNDTVASGNNLIVPFIEDRPVVYIKNGVEHTASVQLTLKPVLSFHQGKDKNKLFEKDYRTSVVQQIQTQLDREGLGHFIARPGGRSSIDVTLAKLDKAYALEFIIDHLNLQGQERNGRHFGSNTIYFGDEVIVGGGNDYPVTRIPGLLTFAVNRNIDRIPCLASVFVPSAIIQEVEATKSILRKLNDIAEDPKMRLNKNRFVLDVFKENLFKARILKKITNNPVQLEAHNWQTLNAFVSLMFRNDPHAKAWLNILVDELDSIMLQLSDRSRISAYGASHHDA